MFCTYIVTLSVFMSLFHVRLLHVNALHTHTYYNLQAAIKKFLVFNLQLVIVILKYSLVKILSFETQALLRTWIKIYVIQTIRIFKFKSSSISSHRKAAYFLQCRPDKCSFLVLLVDVSNCSSML